MIILPKVPQTYHPASERERNRSIEIADRNNRKTGQDVELGDERLIIKSPDGSRFYLTVANDGTLGTTEIT